MATEIYSGPLGAIRTASTAGGGTALTTTASFISLLPGTVWCSMTPRNFATAVVAKVALNPWLIVLKTTDALAAKSNVTDASEAVQDGGALATSALTLNSFDTAANNNFVYVGAKTQFRGVVVTIGNTNSNASVLTVKYWNGTAWGTITPTDGTASGGATFAQTGNVTWTLPTDWVTAPLSSYGPGSTSDSTLNTVPQLLLPYYWTRWETSLAFDSTVTATEMYAMNRNTAQYGELVSGQTLEQRIHRGTGGVGCIETLTDAGTANLIVNIAAGEGGFLP